MGSESGNHTTQILIGRIRAGDATARSELVRRVEPLLRRFAHGRVPQLLRHEQDTADLVQLTWLKVLDKLDSIALAEPGNFFSYLRTVLLNALRESLRRHGRSPIGASSAELGDAVAIAAVDVAPEDWLAYEQTLAALPSDVRALLLMRFEFGMSFGEIGVELGENPDTVRMRLTRAIEKIAASGGALA